MGDGDFDLGLVIKADGSQAVAGADQFAEGLDKVTAAEKRAEAGATGLEGATGKVTRAANEFAGIEKRLDAILSALNTQTAANTKANGSLEAAVRALSKSTSTLTNETEDLSTAQGRAAASARAEAIAEQQLAAATSEAERAAAALALAQIRLGQAQEKTGKNTKGLTDEQKKLEAQHNRNAFGARNLAQQFGDLGLSISGGISPARAFGQQAGQIGFALSEMGGAAGKVGAFLTGPWGIALTIAAAVLAPYVEKLFEANKELDENVKKSEAAAKAADSFGNAQSLLGQIIDLQTGKLKSHNDVLRESIRLQATAGLQKARQDEKDASKEVDAFGKANFGERVSIVASGMGGGGQYGATGNSEAMAATAREIAGRVAPLNDVLTRFNASKIGITQARQEVERLGVAGKLAGREVNDVVLSLVKLGTARNDQKANQQVIDALDGKGIAAELRPYEKDKKPKKPKKPKSTEARDEFGRDAEDRIASLAGQFDDVPSQVDKVNKALTQLDDLVDDIRRKKPLNMEKLLADAAAARTAIVNGLSKPFDDFMSQQVEALSIAKLTAAGRDDEAEALRTILGLEKQMGPLTPARKDAVLATVQALKAEQRETEILRASQQKYLEGLSTIKDAVRGVIFDGFDGLKSLPDKLIGAFTKLKGEQLFDRLFAGAFRELEDQASGRTIVKDASDRMASAVDDANRSIVSLGDTAATAAAKLSTVGPGGAVSRVTPSANPRGLSDAIMNAADIGDPTTRPLDDGDIVVTGRKRRGETKPDAFFSNAVTKLAKGIGISDEAAGKIGQFSGKAIKGAATGALANSFLAPLGKALGFKTSATGAKIGGAIGSVLPIPFGAEIGSVVGSLTGGLLKKTKSGSATIGNVGGEGAVTGTGGNSNAYKKAAGGLADSVIDSLDSVVSALGGELGDFSVSIGQRKKKYVVDASGSGKTKGGGTTSYDTAEEAQAAALANAIADGAVKGLSAAMQRALQSTTDVDKAVAEALKVKTVEALIGGVGGRLATVFGDFDRQAEDYVRTAKKYGLDVLAVEKETAEQRAELIKSTLSDQVGSLTDFLDNLKYGDLAEGSPIDKRKVLLDKIAGVQVDAEAGKSGAADQLANLYQQLISSDRSTFGTAGPEYSDSRAMAETNVQRVIEAATKRVNDAAGSNVANAALVKANELADENNALTAQLVTGVNGLPTTLAALLNRVGVTANTSATARVGVI